MCVASIDFDNKFLLNIFDPDICLGRICNMNISTMCEPKKLITYVSPKTNDDCAYNICTKLPLITYPVKSIEELFPLLSNPQFHTDFVVVSIDMFSKSNNLINMFDILHTLDTLIKSTVFRQLGSLKPKKRNTKIIVVVDEESDPLLVKQVMNLPAVASVGWILKTYDDLPQAVEYTKQILNGDFSHDPRVLNLIKPKKNKKKISVDPSGVMLTTRQSQILEIVKTRGCSNKHIAKLLGISESTVKLHMGLIFKKYGVKNRTQLAVFSQDT